MNEQQAVCCTVWSVVRTVFQRVLLAFGTALLVGGIAKGLNFGEAGGACAIGAAIIVLFAPGLTRRQPRPAAC